MTFLASLDEIIRRNDNGLLGKHETWGRIKLSEIAKVQNGFAFQSAHFTKKDGVPLLRIRDVLDDKTEAFYTGSFDPEYLVEAGDLVIGMDGDFNCALWKGPRAVLNQRVCRVTPDQNFYNRKFLAWVLPGYLRAINAETSSITVKHLSSRTVEDIPLPLPPLSEQQRIVAAIEQHFSRLDAAVAGLHRVRANLKRYRASVLKGACEGRLVPTEAELARAEGRDFEPADVLLQRILAERRAKWEADELAKMQAKGRLSKDDRWKAKYPEPDTPDTSELPELPEGWAWTSIDQLSIVVRGASPRPAGDPRYFGGDTPWITVGSLTAYEEPYLRVVTATVTDAGREASRFIEPDTLLLTNSGATLGVPKITLIGGCINDGSVALQYLDYPTKLYLYYFLKSQMWKLRAINQGAAQPNLNTGIVKRIMVPLPPLAEQERLVAEMERYRAIFERLDRAVEHNLKRAERLRQSILNRAFEGRLVPQDPNDEPASVLLGRMRAERATGQGACGQSLKKRKARGIRSEQLALQLAEEREL